MRSRCLPLLAALVLAACGGGGGSDDAPFNPPPKAEFSVAPNPPQMGVDILFDASASTDNGTISEYQWRFGDGSIGQGRRVTHRYQQAGDISVQLTVTDEQGASTQLRKSFNVAPAYALSGEIQVAGNIVTDSDINDPAATFASNDTRASAQSLPNPAIVNGYVSSIGTATVGDRFALNGDTVDIYLVSLLAGQHISLQLADFDEQDPPANDVNIYLFNTENRLLAASEGEEEFESLVAPASGAGYIMVQSDSGTNKYVLRISNDFSAGRVAANSMSADFVPNELLIRYRDDGKFARALGVDTQQVLSQQQLSGAGAGQRMRLARFGMGQRCLQAMEQLHGAWPNYLAMPQTMQLSSTGASDKEFWRDEKYITLQLIKALKKQPDVEYVEPNYRVRATREPSDTYYGLQWHYPVMNLPAAWDISVGVSASEQIVVAAIDSGALMAHPDLSSRLIDGYDFISDPATAADGDGIDPNPDDVGDQEGPSGQSSFHGTHVTGTIAASTDDARGVAGVTWGAKVMPVRVLGIGGGTGYDLIQGLRYAAGLSNDSGTVPIKRADIINMSLGCDACYNQAMQNTISEARAAGVIIVAAAGNNNNSVPFYPAAYDGVVAVSALNSSFSRAYYSNFGSYIDVTAPGGDDFDRNADGYPDRILSTLGDDSSGIIEFRYGWSSGTSMAAPHVAGVAALMKAVYPSLTPIQFDQLIASGEVVTDLGALGRDDEYGYGLLDALKAVQAARSLGGELLPSSITANPNVLDFAAGLTIKTLHLSAQGDDAPAVNSVTADQPWVRISAGINVDGNGVGDYIIQVDRSALDTAIHQADITVELSDGNTIVVPVYLQVLGSIDGSGDPGLIYVLLRDTSSLEVTHQAEVTRDEDGRFRYQFDRTIGAGKYNIYAGSDIDNDRVICGTGETCGAWPTRNDAQEIHIDRDLTGMDFELVTDADFAVEQERRPDPE